MRALVQSASTIPSPPDRSEYAWLFLACMSALLVRAWYLYFNILEHFDEAVYAGNVWFTAEEGYQYPLREFYAPYLWPIIQEWSQILFGVGKADGMFIPPILCAVATVVSVWWICRQWAGQVAGLTAAWLVACNDLHIAYSRTVLTDVPLTLLLVWSIHTVVILLERPTIRTGVSLGVFTGLAWSIKYSGWLPLAVLLSATIPTGVMCKKPRAWWRQVVLATLTSILTAITVWLPVLWDCQSVGGYLAVATNHSGYVRGWNYWGSGWLTYAERYGDYAWLMAAGWTAAALAIRAMTNYRWPLLWSLGLALQTLYLPQFSWWIIISLAGLVIFLTLNQWRKGNLGPHDITIGCVVSSCFLGLTLTTPLYTPYPRLMLPWWMAAILLLAWGAARLSGSLDSAQHRRLLLFGQVLTMVMTFMALVTLLPKAPCLLESRWSYWDAGDRILVATARDQPIIQVYGLPAVVIMLRSYGKSAVVCGGPELAARVPEGWLVIETRADLDPHWRDGWAKVADRYELVERIPVQPSSVVRFDRPDPNIDPNEAILLYRRK